MRKLGRIVLHRYGSIISTVGPFNGGHEEMKEGRMEESKKASKQVGKERTRE